MGLEKVAREVVTGPGGSVGSDGGIRRGGGGGRYGGGSGGSSRKVNHRIN